MDVNNANLELTINELTSQAVTVARDRYGVTLDLSMNSLTNFSVLIDQARQVYESSNVSGQGLDHTVEVWGAYLGETLRRNRRGMWKIDPEQTGDRRVFLATGNVRIHPFEQVRQRITGQEAALPERDTPPLPPVPEKSKNNLLIILLVALAVFAILGVGATILVQNLKTQQFQKLTSQRAAYEALFQPSMDKYLREYPNPAGSDPVLRGKVLVVSKDTNGIANLQYRLPEELKADNPDDVSVVIQQDCEPVETQTDPKTSVVLTRLSCSLTLIDLSLKEAGYQQDFVSNEFHEAATVDVNGLPTNDPASNLEPTLMISWLEAMIE
jgi:type II secretory pathway pseudopilin PulG